MHQSRLQEEISGAGFIDEIWFGAETRPMRDIDYTWFFDSRKIWSEPYNNQPILMLTDQWV